MDLTADDQPEQQELGCRRTRQRTLGLHSATKLPVKPFNGVGSAKGFPLAVGKTVECQQFLSRLFQAYHYLGSSFFPLHNKCSIRFVPLLQGLRVDNSVVIAFHFFQSMPRYMPLHIAQLMHRAALHLDTWPTLLHRRSQPLVPVDDHQRRPLQTSMHQPSLDSLCKSSKSNTTFCPSALTPRPTNTGADTTLAAILTRKQMASR